MTNHLKELLLALAHANVRFIVCGGVAVVLHGVERMTLDLDVSVWRRITCGNSWPSSRVENMSKEKNALVFTFFDLTFSPAGSFSDR